MAWKHAALVSAIVLAWMAPAVAQENNGQDDGPVPPVYVPEEQQDNIPSGPPAVCQGQNCLPPEQNRVQSCEGQGCTPEPPVSPEESQ
jgi:hypothetical protein